ncbi:MAG: DUF1566 domain-containing protein [Phycisphaerae bacterium]|nr:DUF1566 domain-containing protein [Phycisphaerae bacterium]
MMNSQKTTGVVLVTLATILAASLVGGCPGVGTSSSSSVSSGTSGTTGATTGDETTGSTGTSTASAASVVDLAATGQTTSYAAGDDGDLQKGESLAAAARFVDNGDGTITDQLTGLMWLRDASCLIHNYEEWERDGWAEGWVPWQAALTFIAQINDGTLSACAAGYGDWRLPNVNELESLVNAGQAEQYVWLLSVGFLRVEENDYWTSTTDPDTITTFAYTVNMDDGSVSRLGNKATAPAITSVWPVRGTTDGNSTEIWKTGQTTRYAAGDDGGLQMGIAWPIPRFTDNGDGTITDNLTGLMWLQDAATLSLEDWRGALVVADRFNDDPGHFECENYTATYSDWRVPNRKEFFSLSNFAHHQPALADTHPFLGVSYTGTYWTSTASAADTDRAWHFDMRSGEISTEYKVNGHLVWLVR